MVYSLVHTANTAHDGRRESHLTLTQIQRERTVMVLYVKIPQITEPSHHDHNLNWVTIAVTLVSDTTLNQASWIQQTNRCSRFICSSEINYSRSSKSICRSRLVISTLFNSPKCSRLFLKGIHQLWYKTKSYFCSTVCNSKPVWDYFCPPGNTKDGFYSYSYSV